MFDLQVPNINSDPREAEHMITYPNSNLFCITLQNIISNFNTSVSRQQKLKQMENNIGYT